MRKRLTELFAYMDETRAALIATAGEINPAVAMIRPHGGCWSAAEVVAHLAMVEQIVARMVSSAIAKAREEGIGGDESDDSIMSSLDRFRVTEVVKKITAPPTITPDDNTPVPKSLAAMTEERARLRDTLSAASDLDLKSIKRPHPLLGELDMYQWGLFVAQHEERHCRQIERTLGEVTELAAESAPML